MHMQQRWMNCRLLFDIALHGVAARVGVFQGMEVNGFTSMTSAGGYLDTESFKTARTYGTHSIFITPHLLERVLMFIGHVRSQCRPQCTLLFVNPLTGTRPSSLSNYFSTFVARYRPEFAHITLTAFRYAYGTGHEHILNRFSFSYVFVLFVHAEKSWRLTACGL